MRWLCRGPRHHAPLSLTPATCKQIVHAWKPGCHVENTLRDTDIKPTAFIGACHWPTLRNSMTTAHTYTSWPSVMSYDVAPMTPSAIKTTATTATASSSSSDGIVRVSCIAESVWFQERKIIAGGGILVPNSYQAFIMGCGAVGVYTGGQGGVFWVSQPIINQPTANTHHPPHHQPHFW